MRSDIEKASTPTVLLASPFFFPEPISTGKYNTVLATALADSGKRVIAVCSHPLYPTWTPIRTEAKLRGVDTFRGGTWVVYPRRPALRRAVLEFWFGWHCLISVLRLRLCRIRIDAVVVILPPDLATILLKLLVTNRTPIIGIVHDVQGILTHKANSKGLSALLNWIVKKVESKSFAACSELVFLSQGMRTWSVTNYGVKESLASVQYPFCTPLLPVTDVELREIDGQIDNRKKALVYSGALGIKQDPINLVQLMSDITTSELDWCAYIFSAGPVYESLRDSNVNPRIIYRPLVPERLLGALLKRSTVQIIPQLLGSSGGAFPSKLPNIMRFGTPILCITDRGSELDYITQAYSRGFLSYSWERKEYMATFKRVADSSDFNLESAVNEAECFSVELLVNKINSVVESGC